MTVTIGSLLQDADLGLRVAVDVSGCAEVGIVWAHSSDLPDPTPWLAPDQLLLTNGPPFRGRRANDWDAYAARLVDAGIVALGFATNVVHDVIPAALREACLSRGLPLLEVPGRTPFIAIIRRVADLMAAEQHQRLQWSLSAQRALARAALQPAGLQAVLHELERRLDCWVALYDGAGNRMPLPMALPWPSEVDGEVADRVRVVLARGLRAATRLSTAAGDVTLQTLGHGGHLIGVLVVGRATPLDPAGSDLVVNVIALASIALEQGRALDDARGDLRAGLLELLLAGAADAALATVHRVWGAAPTEPVRVAIVEDGGQVDLLVRDLELRAGRTRGEVFFARRRGHVVVVTTAADAGHLAESIAGYGQAVGVSGEGRWHQLPQLIAEAERARQRADPASAVHFESMYGNGMLALLGRSGGQETAARLLAPLHAAPDGDVLRANARVWLEHNGAWDPAARELGVHRHTLRNRMLLVEGLLGADLETFAGRAELWAALQFDQD